MHKVTNKGSPAALCTNDRNPKLYMFFDVLSLIIQISSVHTVDCPDFLQQQIRISLVYTWWSEVILNFFKNTRFKTSTNPCCYTFFSKKKTKKNMCTSSILFKLFTFKSQLFLIFRILKCNKAIDRMNMNCWYWKTIQ